MTAYHGTEDACHSRRCRSAWEKRAQLHELRQILAGAPAQSQQDKEYFEEDLNSDELDPSRPPMVPR
jgi:hypothetical protein